MLCLIKLNSNTIELTVHLSCYCALDLLYIISLIFLYLLPRGSAVPQSWNLFKAGLVNFSGLDYFYSGYEQQEPFKSEREFLHQAWDMGLKYSSDVQVCSNLNTTHTCTMSSEKLLQTFGEIYRQNEVETDFEDEHGLEKREARTVKGGRKGLMGMLRRIKLLGRPFLRPENAKERAVCVRCEKKRTDCFNFNMGTYGLCGGAWLVAGIIGTATCNIITMPRTIDCTVNAWFNCHQKDCGFVGF